MSRREGAEDVALRRGNTPPPRPLQQSLQVRSLGDSALQSLLLPRHLSSCPSIRPPFTLC